MYHPPGPWKAWENSLTQGDLLHRVGRNRMTAYPCQSYPSLVSTDDRLSSTSVVLLSQLLLQVDSKSCQEKTGIEIIESHCVTSY